MDVCLDGDVFGSDGGSVSRIVRAAKFLSTKANNEDMVDGQHYMIYDKLSTTRAMRVMDAKQSVVLLYKNQSLFAIELPSRLHGAITEAILLAFTRPAGIEMDLETNSNCNITINGNTHQPDGAVSPVVRQPGFDHPTIVVEVACSESLDSVYKSATDYLHANSTVQAFVGIKVWDRNMARTRAMLFMYFDRGGPLVNGFQVPTTIISFGDANLHHRSRSYLVAAGVSPTTIQGVYSGSHDPPCNALGIQMYSFHFPAPLVFTGSVAIPNYVQTFDLDLHFIQSVANRYP